MLPHCTVHIMIKFAPNEKENHLPNQINFQAAPATHRMSACTYDPTRDVPKCCACHEIKSPRVHTTLPMHAPRVHATPDSACTCDPLTLTNWDDPPSTSFKWNYGGDSGEKTLLTLGLLRPRLSWFRPPKYFLTRTVLENHPHKVLGPTLIFQSFSSPSQDTFGARKVVLEI